MSTLVLDLALVARVTAGDPDAREEFAAKYYGDIRGRCLRVIKTYDALDDVTQETAGAAVITSYAVVHCPILPDDSRAAIVTGDSLRRLTPSNQAAARICTLTPREPELCFAERLLELVR